MNEMSTKYGSRVWKNEVGQPHREDGPAIIYSDGTQEWWIAGEKQFETNYDRFISNFEYQNYLKDQTNVA